MEDGSRRARESRAVENFMVGLSDGVDKRGDLCVSFLADGNVQLNCRSGPSYTSSTPVVLRTVPLFIAPLFGEQTRSSFVFAVPLFA